MANDSNSSRNILIVGALLGLAAAGMGGYMMTSAEPKQVGTRIGGESSQAAALTAEADRIQADIKRDRTLADVAPEGAVANGKPRVMPFFFATELWQVPPHKGGTMYDVVDIYDPTVEPIHAGIPNGWFLQHGLLEPLSLSDGDQQDSDGDGFSNREEFDAQTNPADSASLPPLVQTQAGKPVKLEVVAIERANAVITVDSMFATDSAPTEAGIKIYAKVEDRQPLVKATLKKGDSFGLGGNGNAKRFTIVAFEKKEFADSMGGSQSENVIRVRDNDALAEADKEFIVRAGRPRLNDRDRGTPNEKGRSINDVAARIRVTAGPMAGQPAGTLRVPLHASFKVPGNETVSCRLESVDANGSANILPDGAQSPVNIPGAAE